VIQLHGKDDLSRDVCYLGSGPEAAGHRTALTVKPFSQRLIMEATSLLALSLVRNDPVVIGSSYVLLNPGRLRLNEQPLVCSLC